MLKKTIGAILAAIALVAGIISTMVIVCMYPIILVPVISFFFAWLLWGDNHVEDY